MTISQLLESLDGYGLILTDNDLIQERLTELGMRRNTKVGATA
jgi:hypothetical protein